MEKTQKLSYKYPITQNQPLMPRVNKEVNQLNNVIESKRLRDNAQYINDMQVERGFIMQDLIVLEEEVKSLKEHNQDLVEENK